MAFNEIVFVTGFPGFLATRLVRRLAAEGARFILLTLPQFKGLARLEAEQIATDTVADANNFHIIEGDIIKPDLGLSTNELERTRRETTNIFHLAAVYDLAVDSAVAAHVNVEGTLNINNFAKSIENLRRYHYISTCYVAGKREGLIMETELHHEEGFRNHYEETKYLAELEVNTLKAEVPITIHRPAVVCGDSRTGETAKYDGVYYLIHYLRKAPSLLALANIGNRAVRLNVVPVDFVVAAMCALARDERATGATVQLADPAPLTTYELFEVIAQELAHRGSLLQMPPPLVHASLTLPGAEPITGLPRVAVPYFFIEQTYDTTRAQSLLAPHAVHCPPFPAYVGALVAYVAQHPRL